MFKCLLNFSNIKSQIQLNFFKNSNANFSKKFFEKRKKIKTFLSKQKEKYKIEMLDKEYEFKNSNSPDDIFYPSKKSDKHYSENQIKAKKQQRLNNIVNNKNAKIG
jgi:hypothetical protein